MGMQHAILDDLHIVMYMPIEPSENIETSLNICPMIHGLDTFGPIISKLVQELTFNPLLLFHHVVHIPKYSFLELM